jgi:Uma2 family endonuclease
MGMPATTRRWTVAEVLALPDDGRRHEVIAGQLLVTPAPNPRHQDAQGRLLEYLLPYLRTHGAGAKAFAAPADISWDDETLVQPDILVVPKDEVTRSWSTVKTLLLAVEILSPSSAHADRVLKRRLYQRQGVREYWIVDTEAAVVEVWRPSDQRPTVVAETLTWRSSDEAPELVIALDVLFAELPE